MLSTGRFAPPGKLLQFLQVDGLSFWTAAVWPQTLLWVEVWALTRPFWHIYKPPLTLSSVVSSVFGVVVLLGDQPPSLIMTDSDRFWSRISLYLAPSIFQWMVSWTPPGDLCPLCCLSSYVILAALWVLVGCQAYCSAMFFPLVYNECDGAPGDHQRLGYYLITQPRLVFLTGWRVQVFMELVGQRSLLLVFSLFQ